MIGYTGHGRHQGRAATDYVCPRCGSAVNMRCRQVATDHRAGQLLAVAAHQERRLAAVRLSRGDHATRAQGVCAMEAVAWLAGEAHSDRPQCACPIIGAFVRRWNDGLPDADRGRVLKPLLPLLVGSRSTLDIEVQRSYMALDWMVRVQTVAWLRCANLGDAAASIAASPITGSECAASAILPQLKSAQAQAAAAGAAAGAGAVDAAWAAAVAAAGDALRPTTMDLQLSAVELVHRMLALGGSAAGATVGTGDEAP